MPLCTQNYRLRFAQFEQRKKTRKVTRSTTSLLCHNILNVDYALGKRLLRTKYLTSSGRGCCSSGVSGRRVNNRSYIYKI